MKFSVIHFLVPTLLLLTQLMLPAEQVVFSEIHYNPKGDKPEYLEIYNLTATPLDIANWKFSKGVDYEFPDFNETSPDISFIKSFERILIAGVDEQTLRKAYVIPASTKIYGPWSGGLSNNGELLELEDKNGVIRASVEYNDDGRKWSVAADGAGHSLRLIRENRGGSNWRNWGVSLASGGTPGSAAAQDEGQVTQILEVGSSWKYDQSGSNHGSAWRESDFDDSAWDEGPGFFGKESANKVMPQPGFQTSWTTGGRITYYLRREFQWNEFFSAASIKVDGLFDDGVVVYLNGQEIGRNSMPAGVIDWQTAARSHEARTYESIVQGDITALLQVGTNVLAVEVHNVSSGSSDIVFGADVLISSIPVDQTELIRLSEVHCADDGRVDWVELHAPGQGAVSLDGFAVASQPDFSDAVMLEGSIPGGGYASREVDFPIAENGNFRIYVIAGNNVLDAHRFDRDSGEASFQSDPPGVEWFGGSGHSRNAANTPSRNTDIVINEIMYDAPSDGRNAEFVELYNRGVAAVDLGGWRFVDGIGFDFPSATVIAPGDYLVVAADAGWVRDNYGEIPVMGDFSGQLSDSGELLRLEDAMGNLVDQVDYLPSGDWPELADGDGSSMELRHPQMDNDSPSAWADSDESQKASMQTITYTDNFERVRWNPLTGGQELHMHLVGDAHVIIEDVAMRLNDSGANLISNPSVASPDNSSSRGWVCQGTHWASYIEDGQLHLIADGHGDNKANRAEIDIGNLSFDQSYTLSFNARWVSGKSRLIAQTLDHGFGTSFHLSIPNNLGTPGTANSRQLSSPAPVITGVVHSPAVPKPPEQVKVTAKVTSALPLNYVDVVHRLDSSSGNNGWVRAAMHDDGVSGGDLAGGDGIYTATLSSYRTQGNIAQFYVAAGADGGNKSMQPKLGSVRPAMFIIDSREMPGTLMSERLIVSLHDRSALGSAGHSPTFAYKFPRMSNHFFNATFIANESEIFYNAEIRKSGSPFTRDGGSSLAHGKWKLPEDRLFRERRRSVFDASGTSEGSGTPRFYDDRIARQFLYLLGHPINEMEFVHLVVNGDAFKLRENHEPISNDFMDRNFAGGSEGTLLRIDDEWRFTSDDGSSRSSRNADWSYKNSDNPIRYHSEWLMRSREADYDFSNFIEFVKAVGTNSFNEQSINRIADRDMLCINAAVRGYDADWDTLTVNRGKNAYFYRPKGGRWMLVHWDGDRVFSNANQSIIGGLSGVRTYFDKPYIRRTLNYYLTELLTRYTRGSARTAAWMEFEQQAIEGTGIIMTANHYSNWFNSRESNARNFIGAPFSTAFRITTNNAVTSETTVSLSGTAPSSVYNVRVAGQPGLEALWTSTTGWSLPGVGLMSGNNVITVEGVNHEGTVIHSEQFRITKTGNSPPVVVLETSPSSGNVALNEVFNIDASGSYDPEGEELTFNWLSPPEGVTLTGDGARAAAAFVNPGSYLLAAEVADASGNISRATKEVLVFAGRDFSSFGSDLLDTPWEGLNLEVMDNTPNGASYSLATVSGALHIMVPEDRDYPLGLPQVGLPAPLNYLTLGDTWRYSDENIDFGTQFAEPGFDDSAWQSGPGIFGYDSGTFPAPGLQTPLARDTANQLITYYFRSEFEFDRDPIGSLITISAILDDGARFWLNGQEVGRVRLPAAPAEIGWKTVASSSTLFNQERALLPAVSVDGSGLLVEGKNLIAVDLHNITAASSDRVMGLNLDIAAHPAGLGGEGIGGTIHPWLRRDLPDEGDWILQTDLELYGLQFGEFMTGLMVEVERDDSRFRYGIGYCNGDELAVVQVTPAGTTGKLFSLPFSSTSEMVVRVRRQGNELIFEWRPGELFEEVYRITLPGGSTAIAGGPFAATEAPQLLNVLFDYVALADASSISPFIGDLVITEVMYKPEGGSRHEFLELYNAGSTAIDLNGFRFPQGEPFDELILGNVAIDPGAYILVVKDLAAFRSRYGNGFDSIIAGEWRGGSLDNNGEVITLLDAQGLIVISFAYRDVDPWPVSPDTDGTSLVLIDPSGGNTASGADWTASLQIGGSPGRAEDAGEGFASWMAFRGEVDPLATKSGDVLNNLLTYALGADLAGGNAEAAMLAAGIVTIGGQRYFTMSYHRRMDATDIVYAVDFSPDNRAWEEAGNVIVEVSSEPAGDGVDSVTVRLAEALDNRSAAFLRLRVTAP